MEPLSPSPASDVSAILLLMGDWDAGVGREFRTGSDCSFEGGAGGRSDSGMFELSPSGPRGPRESSIASSRVACGPTFRGVRGFLPTGDRGDEDAGGAEVGDCFVSDSESSHPKPREQIRGMRIERQTSIFDLGSFRKAGIRART